MLLDVDDDGFGTVGYEEFLKDPKDEILKLSQHLEGSVVISLSLIIGEIIATAQI